VAIVDDREVVEWKTVEWKTGKPWLLEEMQDIVEIL
jgi:hypothetical protein